MKKQSQHKPAIILAGTNSGCGKTSTTIALLAVLKQAGLHVQAFKTGPDYIDPAFHSRVLQSPSYNLDTQMLGADTCRHLFHKHAQGADISVVEGVMGLFDGMGKEAKGSTAELAKELKLPVVLVINASGMYQSVAALVKGFADFDPELNIAGVIFNRLKSPMLYAQLKTFVEACTSVKCIGYLPDVPHATLASRHLGLIQAEEIDTLQQKTEALRDALAPCIDLDVLKRIASQARTEAAHQLQTTAWERPLTKLRLAIARDAAFSFYYQDNLNVLQEQGAELIPFSPLKDAALPANCNAVYIGGGYPEVYAKQLWQNSSMLESIRTAAESGLPIYGECGGMMYLCQAIEDLEGERIGMAGIFNTEVKMTTKLVRFGYCQVHFDGASTQAHEFHRSDIVAQTQPNYQLDFDIEKPNKKQQWQGGLRYKNVLAGYPHVHFYASAAFYHKLLDLWTQHT